MRKIKPKHSKLNIGSGFDYREGYVNLDVTSEGKPDIVCDIEKGIPLEDGSIEFVLMRHVFEHIDPRKFNFVMSELYRICKPGAKILIYCPYFSCGIHYKCYDHIMFVSYFTFQDTDKFKVEKKELYFFRKSFAYNRRGMAVFVKALNPLLSFFANAMPLLYERLFCWIFPMEEIEIVLKVIKTKK
jgi:SAM-dependent methyltransferase